MDKGGGSLINPYMAEALKEAQLAFDKNEIPVGAVIVRDNKIIARAHNLRETQGSAIAHAEVLAIQEACRALSSWRLSDCDLYVTLEPCPMCAGAIVNARLKSVYFGAWDEKAGCCGSVVQLMSPGLFNHTPILYEGIMEEPCRELLRRFFMEKRTEG